jgi:hypothetical protein
MDAANPALGDGIIDGHRPNGTLSGVHVHVSRTTGFASPSDRAIAVGLYPHLDRRRGFRAGYGAARSGM